MCTTMSRVHLGKCTPREEFYISLIPRPPDVIETEVSGTDARMDHESARECTRVHESALGCMRVHFEHESAL